MLLVLYPTVSHIFWLVVYRFDSLIVHSDEAWDRASLWSPSIIKIKEPYRYVQYLYLGLKNDLVLFCLFHLALEYFQP